MTSVRSIDIGQCFDFTNELTNIELPLCDKCATYLIQEMNIQVESIEEEIKAYQSFMKSSENGFYNDSIDLENEIKKIKEDEEKLLVEIESQLNNLKELDSQTSKLNSSKEKINQLEVEFTDTYRRTIKKRFIYNDEEQNSFSLLDWTQESLEKFRKSYFLDDAFHIWHCGHFASINGLRIGNLKSQVVDVHEINAGWGYLALLADTLRKKLEVTWKDYEITLLGSHTRIGKKGKTGYPLFAQRSNLKFISYNQYDKALCAILQCIKELEIHIQSLDSTYFPPYSIDKDKINGVSIKDGDWTKATKLLLTNIKYIVAWVAKNEENLRKNIMYNDYLVDLSSPFLYLKERE